MLYFFACEEVPGQCAAMCLVERLVCCSWQLTMQTQCYSGNSRQNGCILGTKPGHIKQLKQTAMSLRMLHLRHLSPCIICAQHVALHQLAAKGLQDKTVLIVSTLPPCQIPAEPMPPFSDRYKTAQPGPVHACGTTAATITERQQREQNPQYPALTLAPFQTAPERLCSTGVCNSLQQTTTHVHAYQHASCMLRTNQQSKACMSCMDTMCMLGYAQQSRGGQHTRSTVNGPFT